MSDYPEALIEKVAQAIAVARVPRKAWDTWTAAAQQEFRLDAVAALDALGLREEQRVAEWFMDTDKRRYVTEWEDA